MTTLVSHRSADDARWAPESNSITYFHAGKVYDRIEKIGEVVIFEPTQSRFVILSFNGNHLATIVQFEELQQFLKVARVDIDAHANKLDPISPKGSERQRRQALMFQLTPQFESAFDPTSGTLSLSSPLMRYEVVTQTADRPLVTQQYLQYADWAAKLNYVLHSGSIHPDVRIAVNRELANRQRIPIEVRLHLEGDRATQLRAEHGFHWQLTASDKALIRRCENARTDEGTEWVSFRDYQRTLLAATAASRPNVAAAK